MTRFPFLLCLTGLALMLWTGSPMPSLAAKNPFLGGGAASNATAPRSVVGYPKVFRPLLDKAARVQLQLRQSLVNLGRDIKEHPLGRSFWLFMLSAFAYGVVHALGPGHGKLFVCSYFLNRPGSLSKGMAFGFLTMFSHVLSATVLVCLGYFVLRTSGALTLADLGPRLETASYGLLALIGLFLLLKSFLGLRGRLQDRASHDCTAQHAGARGNRGLILTACSIGLVPCPGAGIILVAAVSMGILTTGLLAMAAIGMGMGLTTTLFALATIQARKGLYRILAGHERTLTLVHFTLTLLGSVAIFGLGALLFLTSL